MPGEGDDLKNLIWGQGLNIEDVAIAVGMSRQSFAYHLNKAKVSEKIKEKVIKFLRDHEKGIIKQEANKNLQSTIKQTVNNSDSEVTHLKEKIIDLERIIEKQEELIKLLKGK